MVYISFIILSIILLIIGFYFILSLVYRKINKKKILEEKKEIFHTLESILNRKENNTNIPFEILKSKFSSGRGIEAFYLAYKKYVEKHGYGDELKQLLNQVVDYQKIIKSKVVKKSYRKSYMLFLILEFQLDSPEIGKIALESLNDDSIYVRNNALGVIQNQGEIQKMIQTLDIVNKQEKHFNIKMLTDFLDNFKGDIEKLDQQLLNSAEKYNPIIKAVIIDHFTNARNKSKGIRDRVLDCIECEDDFEMSMKCIRYFFHVEDTRAAEYLLRNMDNGSWSIRANSAKALLKYPDKTVIEKLKQTMGDENYFVRKNSAETFIQLMEKEEVFHEAVFNEDQFIRDILLYTIEKFHIEGFDEYVGARELIENKYIEKEKQTIKELNVEWT